MTVRIEVAGLMTGMVMMLTGARLLGRVAMSVLIEISWRMARMVVVRAGHFRLPRLVAVAVLVEVTRLVSRMVVMLTRLLFRHLLSPTV